MPQLFIEKVHYTFEEWFIRLFLEGLLDGGLFTIMEMRGEYISLCLKEEKLWKEWCANAEATTLHSPL